MNLCSTNGEQATILKGRKLYTGSCGDAMAMVVELDVARKWPTP